MSPARQTSIDLKKLLSTAQVPALPQSAIRLLELSRDEENGPAEFAVAIEVDPGLAGQVLRFVNHKALSSCSMTKLHNPPGGVNRS